MAKAIEWEEIGREVTYKKYSQKIERRNFKLPDGRVEDFYIRIEDPGACVLAITSDNEVITLPQYRPGPKKILRELPGGKVDMNEDSRHAAERELLEETGYKGKVDEGWIGHWYSDAYTDSDRSIIIVKDCQKVATPAHDANEFGEIELVPMPEFVVQARSGQLTDAAGVLLALDYLGVL